MAIVGMDLHMGDCDNLDDFYMSLLLGRQHFKPLPPERLKGIAALHQTMPDADLSNPSDLKGAWVEDLDIDLLQFRIQPKEAEQITPQQALMLKVADRAIQDANLHKPEEQGATIAVIISDCEEYSLSEHTGFIDNIIASRIATVMDFAGPAFTISSNENGVYKALEIAQNLLAKREVDAVVLGAVDLGSGLERIVARQAIFPVHTGSVSMGWDHSTQGWTIGEGAGAIVLKRADDAIADRVYARIDDLAIRGPAILQPNDTHWRGVASASPIAEAAEEVLSRQQLRPSDIGYLEVSASGIAEEDQAEIAGLTAAYHNSKATVTCALGSSKAHIGHTFAASGIASIIKTALSLYHRFLPGVPNWEGPSLAAPFMECPFYVPDFSRPWVPEKGLSTLRAAISGLAADGTSAHVLLSEGTHARSDEPSTYLHRGGERLFPVQDTTLNALLSQLADIENQLTITSFRHVSDWLCAAFTPAASAHQTLVLVAASNAELIREIGFFRAKLPAVDASKGILQTPVGSYFTAKPLGHTGKLAIVYPGSGSMYVGAGATIFQAFPDLYNRLKTQGYDPADALRDDVYPRSLFALSPAEKQARERQLQTNASAMMLTGCTFSGLFTKVLQDHLGVQADSALGYSMGETSAMWYCQDIWSTIHVERKFWQAPLFREKVGGRMSLLAELWRVSEAEARQRWSSQLIHVSNVMSGYASLADWFRQAVAPVEPRVFLTFINTDTEIILSGDSADLDRVLAAHQLTTVPLTINNVVHHDFCRRLTDELLEMHQLPIEHIPGKTFYSSITTQPLLIDSDALANNALEVCCRPVDWPRIVRKLSADKHKLFVEVGANATCSRWIADILREQEHAVLPMDRKGASVLRNLTGLVARLLAHGVSVNLTPFFENEKMQATDRKPLLKTLHTDGHRFESLLLTPENRPHFLQKIRRIEPTLVKAETSVLRKMAFQEPQTSSCQSNTDLQLISRVLWITGERFAFQNNPEIVTEYDVPTDAWYYTQNAAPEIPYSILMEIALQPCGFLGVYLGSTQLFPEKDLFFRNLDGTGDLIRLVDLRGKTITNQVCLQSHTALNGTILQGYSFELRVDDAVFYRGMASFGFFTKEDLSSQVGLDRGKHVAPWYETQPANQLNSLSFKLDSLFGRMKLYRSVNPTSPQLHLASDQLNLLDTAITVKDGGNYGKGYIFARKSIEAHNWFFTCHFYQDPVMPGSLGVEAILQAMQLFVLQQGLADGLSTVSFRQTAPHKTIWKHKGQISATDSEMRLEVHIKTIDRTERSLTLTADANLWKDSLRIYTVTDIGLSVR